MSAGEGREGVRCPLVQTLALVQKLGDICGGARVRDQPTASIVPQVWVFSTRINFSKN